MKYSKIFQKYLNISDLIAIYCFSFPLFWGAKIGLISHPRYEKGVTDCPQLLFVFTDMLLVIHQSDSLSETIQTQ